MNIRKMKLALTVDLMNLSAPLAPVTSARNTMSRFENETGIFKGLSETQSTSLNNGIERKVFALRFENVTLDLDLITNSHNSEQFIKGFDLKENYA